MVELGEAEEILYTIGIGGAGDGGRKVREDAKGKNEGCGGD